MIRKATGWLVASVMSAAMVWCPAVAEAAPAPASKSLTVRVMTFNILYAGKKHADGVPDADLAWSKRGPAVAGWIRWNSPDVVGFQENETTVTLPNGRTGKQLAAIDDEMLPDYQFVQITQSTPIAFRRAKFTLVSDGVQQVAWKGRDSSSRDRWLVWAVLKDRQTGQPFLALNTHEVAGHTAGDDTSRIAQTKRITAKLQQLNPGLSMPFTLTGDFNINNHATGRTREPITLLGNAGMVDSYTTAAVNTSEVPKSSSWSSFGTNIDGKYRYRSVRTSDYHIDYVWAPKTAQVRNWKVSSGPNIRQVKVGSALLPFFASTGVLPSDHSPVVSTVTFPAR